MTYHRRNKRKINKTVLIIIVVLIILFFFGPNVKGITQWFANPIVTTKNAVISPFKNSVEYFKFKQELIDENELLKEENKKLKIENLTVTALKSENKSLKELLDYQDRDENFVIAKIINNAPFSPYDTFVVDLNNQNVAIGAKVYYLGVLLGEIEEVYSKNAVVRLHSSSDEKIFVNIGEQQAEATGIGGHGFVISLPKDIAIEKGEVIFVEGDPVGQVDEIINDQTGAFQNIYFRYPFNMNEIDFVQIENN
jgi:cell shape-determining protein MreC